MEILRDAQVGGCAPGGAQHLEIISLLVVVGALGCHLLSGPWSGFLHCVCWPTGPSVVRFPLWCRGHLPPLETPWLGGGGVSSLETYDPHLLPSVFTARFTAWGLPHLGGCLIDESIVELLCEADTAVGQCVDWIRCHVRHTATHHPTVSCVTLTPRPGTPRLGCHRLFPF